VGTSDPKGDTTPAESGESWLTLAAICCVVCILWAGSGIILWPLSNRGEFGDMFGAVNALFSGLAFAGLIFTIHVQRRELSLQRQELSLQRRELEASREVLAQQEATMRSQGQTMADQRFEASLFSLIDSHIRAVDSLQYRGRDGVHIGRAALSALFHEATVLAADDINHRREASGRKQRIRSNVNHVVDSFYAENTNYFSGLRYIFEFVNGSGRADKERYLRLLQTQVTVLDRIVLMMASLADTRTGIRRMLCDFRLLRGFTPTRASDTELSSTTAIWAIATDIIAPEAFAATDATFEEYVADSEL
jgi:hypothetical protein